jgi:hypothetical protein
MVVSMRKLPKPSRQERLRKKREATDNHKARRKFGSLCVNAGYERHLSKVLESGRKEWYYTRVIALGPMKTAFIDIY